MSKKTSPELTNFYKECEKLFHDYAVAVGFANKGIQEAPDLKPKREIFVATLLQDEKLADACHDNEQVYYYNVIRYCTTAGIEYGAQWILKPEGFEEENYDEILYRNNVGRSSGDITTDIVDSPAKWKEFLIGLHRVWASQMEPYFAKDGSGDYVMQSCFALFQLGVSIAFDKFDK